MDQTQSSMHIPYFEEYPWLILHYNTDLVVSIYSCPWPIELSCEEHITRKVLLIFCKFSHQDFQLLFEMVGLWETPISNSNYWSLSITPASKRPVLQKVKFCRNQAKQDHLILS